MATDTSNTHGWLFGQTPLSTTSNPTTTSSTDQSSKDQQTLDPIVDPPKTPSVIDLSPQIQVDKDVIHNEETLKYMRIVDMYKKLGIGKDIELPRLVIAGTQSCGKSSLLENLTGLPVPIATGIGTRFPIEITLMEDKRFQIKPNIVLDPKAPKMSATDLEKIMKFNLAQIYNEPMTQAQFENLLREASSLFGVKTPLFARDKFTDIRPVDAPMQEISSHILQIEMKGPDFRSLSFVDTPGLYSSGSNDQGSAPIVEIENLVVSLIAEKRTIIVAVMEASQLTNNQKIFAFADDVDIEGARTLGVLTKCDIVNLEQTDDFEATLRRAKNQDRVLKKHGWYLVKNRSSTEAKANMSLEAARVKESQLFASPKWSPDSSGIQPDRMGIAALRTGLSNVFCAHIRDEFPFFNQQTQDKLIEKRNELSSLGPARSTVSEQREYLRTIVTAYQEPKFLCLNDDLRSESHVLNTYLLIRKLTFYKKSFLRDSLTSTGAVWAFKTPVAWKDDASDLAASALMQGKTKNIYTWINQRYQSTKSCQIPGVVPYALLERLFEEQTANWKTVTDSFLIGVESLFLAAVNYCLDDACSNKLIAGALQVLVNNSVKDKMKDFRAYCHQLIRNEQNGLQLIAAEEQFVRNMREARTLRFISAIAKLETEPFLSHSSPAVTNTSGTTFSTFGGFGGATAAAKNESPGGSLFATAPPPVPGTGFGAKTPGLFDNVNTTPSQSTFGSLLAFVTANKDRLKDVLTDDRQIIYEIHDILKAYYSTSVQHYTDSVCKDGLKDSFVKDVMDLFSNKFVDSLSDEEVSKISAESVTDRKKRRELKEDIQNLERAISESEAILREPIAGWEDR